MVLFINKNTKNTRRPPKIRKKFQVRFGTINVTTASDDSRLDDHARLAAQANLTVVALQETKRRGVGSKLVETIIRDGKKATFEFHWRGYKKSPPKEESLAGVGFLIKKSKDIVVEEVDFDSSSPRILTATILIRGTRYFFINNYLYTETANRPKGMSDEDYDKNEELHMRKKDRQYAAIRKAIKSKPKKIKIDNSR